MLTEITLELFWSFLFLRPIYLLKNDCSPIFILAPIESPSFLFKYMFTVNMNIIDNIYFQNHLSFIEI